MSKQSNPTVATMGIDIGKNSFHVVGLDQRGAIVPRQKWSRGQIETRLAAMVPCLIGMEACVGAHHLCRELQALGHDASGVIYSLIKKKFLDHTGADAIYILGSPWDTLSIVAVLEQDLGVPVVASNCCAHLGNSAAPARSSADQGLWNALGDPAGIALREIVRATVRAA